MDWVGSIRSFLRGDGVLCAHQPGLNANIFMGIILEEETLKNAGY
jgi:hypothetical protein